MLNKINNFIKRLALKANQKFNDNMSYVISDDILKFISFDSQILENWNNWFNSSIKELNIKTKNGVPIYELEFPFVEYLIKPGFLQAFPGFGNLLGTGGFCATTLVNENGIVDKCLIVIDSITKNRLSEEEYKFFKFHEIGHCYYEHLFNSNLIGVLDDINLEYEADAYANEMINLEKSFQFDIFKISNIAAAVVTDYNVNLLQLLGKNMNNDLKKSYNKFIFLNKLFITINLIKRNIKLR